MKVRQDGFPLLLRERVLQFLPDSSIPAPLPTFLATSDASRVQIRNPGICSGVNIGQHNPLLPSHVSATGVFFSPAAAVTQKKHSWENMRNTGVNDPEKKDENSLPGRGILINAVNALRPEVCSVFLRFPSEAEINVQMQRALEKAQQVGACCV